MKRKIIAKILILIVVGLLAGRDVSAAEESSIVKLSYKILESKSSGQTLTTLVKLKARNVSDAPINNVNASVSYVENMSIDVNTIYFGNINARETALSPESITISVDNGDSQEDPPISKLIWRVEYTNSGGERVVEEISF
ncbi:MAG: hypothetical protein HS132_03115 [Planctomycetia bacterium]|nr:hypothetical protein [Planctomycetia bacterium]